MPTIKRFEELDVWKKSRDLTKYIYSATSSGEFNRDFGLREQIRRASVSITSNIAEGFERGTAKEFQHFLHIAKGSAAEVRSQLCLAFELKYLDLKDFEMLTLKSLEICRMLASLISYLKNRPK